MADPHYDAHVKSIEADNHSQKLGSPHHSLHAVNASHRQDHKEAVKHHIAAAAYHANLAGPAATRGKDGPKHYKAMRAHRAAADAHDAASSNMIPGGGSQHSEQPKVKPVSGFGGTPNY